MLNFHSDTMKPGLLQLGPCLQRRTAPGGVFRLDVYTTARHQERQA